MNKHAKSKNTFKLIYEFNNDSSLFARLAASELDNKNYNTAIEILEKGIKKFPSYPTASLIYSTALAYQGKTDEALSCLENIKEYFPNEATITFYKERIQQIYDDQNSLKESSRFSFAPGNLEGKEVFEDNLESIAHELSKAKIKIKNPIVGTIPVAQEIIPTKKIVSETMARIFLGQGNLKEALSVYEDLILSDPKREGYFLSKIDEIKALLGS
jgi:tetratricopeptide (TPR) repeat protein